jgi:hypothetical protein
MLSYRFTLSYFHFFLENYIIIKKCLFKTFFEKLSSLKRIANQEKNIERLPKTLLNIIEYILNTF